MRILRVAALACLASGCAASAFAQYGLYGSPEVLPVGQQNPGVVSASGYSAPAAYPGMTVPAQPGPVYAQPQYRYPAQPQATAMYQPARQPAPQQYPQYSPYPPVQQPARWSGTYARGMAAAPQVAPQPAPQMQPAQQMMPVPPMPVPPPTPNGQMPAPENMAMPNEPAQQQGQGVTNQMLAEPGCYGGAAYYNGCDNGCGPYRGAVGRFEQAACGGSACGDCGGDGCGACSPWYASVMALTLSRGDGRRLWTSYESGNSLNQLTNTQDVHMPWKWGGELTFGRRFCWCCNTWAVQATYWSTEAMTGNLCTVSPVPGGLVSTPLQVGDMAFNGETAMHWFDNAQEHRLSRRDEFQNIEVNLLRLQTPCYCDSPWDIGWSLGVRYFRLQENLTFGTLRQGCVWGQGGGAFEAYLNDTVTNDLLGFQIGFDAAYCLFDGFRAFVTPKMGIYDNHMTQDFRANLGNGTVATTGTSGVPGTYPVLSSRDQLAFLMQIDVGLDWQLSRNWSARVGYRVLALTGMALADDQFPQYIVDIPEIAHIDGHSSLILHGAFAGLTYNF